MNMITHKPILLEAENYILLPVNIYVLYIEIDKINHILSLFAVTFSKFGNGSELESSHHYHFRNNSVSVIIST